MQNRWLILGLSVLFSAMLWVAGRAQAVITYQGYLRMGGAPANGNYDFIFTLYDDAMAGNQVGVQVRINNKLVRNGLYTVELDFGPHNVIWNALPARNRWLEIQVRPAGGGNFIRLAPRVRIHAAPYAWAAFPVGPAAGDLAGNYPNPLVVGFRGLPLAQFNAANPPNVGDFLFWDGGFWRPAGGVGRAGPVNGALLFWNAGAGLWQPMAVPPVVGNVPVWNGNAWVPGVIPPGGPAGGDLFGNYPNPMVAGLRGRPISPNIPQTGQVLKWDGLMWTPANDLTDGNFTLPFTGGAAVQNGATFSIANPAPTGQAVAISGASASTSGTGILGEATATTGEAYGVIGRSASQSGRGVFGEATASSGNTYGMYGRASSSSGVGVFGEATASSGDTRGILGRSSSTSGVGVLGEATATTGSVYGVHGRSSSSSGAGVFGEATATAGSVYGVQGRSSSTSGVGVFGEATATSGDTRGILGRSSSTSGVGVFGEATATSGDTRGILGRSSSTSGVGVFGEATATSGDTRGILGRSSSTSGVGVFGEATATSGSTRGILGRSSSSSGVGVFGEATATSGNTYGIVGRASSTSGVGVLGEATATTGNTYGGLFQNPSSSGAGVYGYAQATTGTNFGVVGRSESPSGRGVVGVAEASTGTNYGVLGRTNSSANGWGVYAGGRLGASGTKSFQIDHPLRPETHFLNHFCIEAPEPYNLYRGTVTLDAQGEAWVQLPDYFEAINRDASYHLTPIGAAMPNLHVAVEIQGNRFKIAGGAPFKKVSWEVKAVRNDPWVQQYGYQTEQEKPKEYQGLYLHPELYGQPKERGIFYTPTQEPAYQLPAKP
jgi:hypothetical protein